MAINHYLKTISGKPLTQKHALSEDIILSKANQFYAKNSSSHFSLKVVLNGTERYKVNGRTFAVQKDSFLIVNPNAQIELNIEEQNTEGFCLFPSTELVKDVHFNNTKSEIQLLDNPFGNVDLPHFTEKIINLKENSTGQFLAHQIEHIYNASNNDLEFDTNTFYLKLSEFLIKDQIKLETLLKSLNSSKKTTKEELYRRVDVAKKFIEDNYTEKISLDDVAASACLSKYHFTRSFKSLYRLSPVQYLLQIRLDKASELLKKDYSFTEVTNIVGFSDAKNLRKAIKKYHAA